MTAAVMLLTIGFKNKKVRSNTFMSDLLLNKNAAL